MEGSVPLLRTEVSTLAETVESIAPVLYSAVALFTAYLYAETAFFVETVSLHLFGLSVDDLTVGIGKLIEEGYRDAGSAFLVLGNEEAVSVISTGDVAL